MQFPQHSSAPEAKKIEGAAPSAYGSGGLAGPENTLRASRKMMRATRASQRRCNNWAKKISNQHTMHSSPTKQHD
jgi:hypothetical protein